MAIVGGGGPVNLVLLGGMAASAQGLWRYSLATDAKRRLQTLLARYDFDALCADIASTLSVLCCHRSEIKGTAFRRPVYTVRVSQVLFDAFFNSPAGYRGAYFVSPGFGVDANGTLLRALAPRLLDDPATASCNLDRSLIQESLLTPSAKAWLAERGKEIDAKCAGCDGEWGASSPSRAEILNGRWDCQTGQKSEWGRQAPYLTKIRIMGAFLDGTYAELVPHDKRFRAREIHDYGWS